jgi:cell wall-active antibiotic response 4TMS protein YvqF
MAEEVPTPPGAATPAPSSQPPAVPGPYATRQEWRAWRRQTRNYYGSAGWTGWSGIWGWFWAIALIMVGGYYLAANLGFFDWVRGDLIWPALLIVLGVLVLVGRFRPGRA